MFLRGAFVSRDESAEHTDDIGRAKDSIEQLRGSPGAFTLFGSAIRLETDRHPRHAHLVVRYDNPRWRVLLWSYRDKWEGAFSQLGDVLQVVDLLMKDGQVADSLTPATMSDSERAALEFDYMLAIVSTVGRSDSVVLRNIEIWLRGTELEGRVGLTVRIHTERLEEMSQQPDDTDYHLADPTAGSDLVSYYDGDFSSYPAYYTVPVEEARAVGHYFIEHSLPPDGLVWVYDVPTVQVRLGERVQKETPDGEIVVELQDDHYTITQTDNLFGNIRAVRTLIDANRYPDPDCHLFTYEQAARLLAPKTFPIKREQIEGFCRIEWRRLVAL